MICQHLRDMSSPIVGVLYFDSASGSLFFMNKDQTAHPQKLTGTRPEIIQKETGYPPRLLFTYYDQDHITGTDILQEKDTIAVMTGGNTPIHAKYQGGRRLRGLFEGQRLISTFEQGDLSKIGTKINKPELATFQVEKFPVHKLASEIFFFLNTSPK